jgi:aminoglycoside phosphotransferase (APT) family kinase protein
MSQFLPSQVIAAIRNSIGVDALITPLAGGTNQRTYLVQHQQQQWVARAEPAPALSLQRAVLAQSLAHAGGVRTPTTIASDQTETPEGLYHWSIETYSAGIAFDEILTDQSAAIAATRDLGKQLRQLHRIPVDAFGDQPPRPYPVYPSATAWLHNKAARIAPALALSGASPAMAAQIEQIYALLGTWYAGAPYLAKGDCAGGNLLVDRSYQVTLIDWEWAQGLDPAADMAYWCHFTPDPELHEVLLATYAPPDLAAFRRRVLGYRIVHSIELMHVYSEHEHALDHQQRTAAIVREAATLQRLLAQARSTIDW